MADLDDRGIHLITCRNLHVSDCELLCGDDAICVTSVESRSRGFCENITVSNCTMSSRSAGIRVGYGPNTIRDSQATVGTTRFVRHRSVTDAGLSSNNDLAKATQGIDPQPSPFAPVPH